ncbi:MAG: efflux RND transporter periplasmic adaptor subunit [Rhodocyclaceae bacterium]|nr:efflux RND transporter periplasmic adaptor subunit [Rhodocyclaceae bacterium]
MNPIIFVLPLSILLMACSPPAPPEKGPRLVRVMTVGAGDTPLVRDYSGEVRAKSESTLGFRIPGKLVTRLVDVGATVTQGQPLARLDPSDAGLQATQAEAQRSIAAADAARYRDLRSKNFVSQAALDARESALAASEAQAGLARNQTAYTTLFADRTGVITQVLAEPGQVVAAGQPVFRLAPDGEREIAISLPETDIGSIKLGQSAIVTLWAKDGVKIKGTVREISPAADPLTRTYATRIRLSGVDARLPLGMTATVGFETKVGKNAVVVPLSAIFQQGDKATVWIVGNDASVSLKPVTIAAYTDNGAVISDGLKGGERIAAAGVHRLVAGEKVRVIESAGTPK